MKNEVASIREEMRLTPKEFGALFNVHRTTVMRWERDEKPHPPEAMLRWMRDEIAKFRERKQNSDRAAVA